MTGMDDRRKGFEAKWAHDAETRFKVEARRNRALGLWAAAEKGLTGQAAEDFADSVVAADFGPAFFAMGLLAVSSMLFHRRLADDAGSEVSGHRKP